MSYKVILSVVFVFLLIGSVFAQNSGMIVKVENGLIIVNKGLKDGLSEGQELYVKRINKSVAKVKIEKIADYYCGTKVLSLESGDEIKIGDQISLEPLKNPSTSSSSSALTSSQNISSKQEKTSAKVAKTPTASELAKAEAKQRENQAKAEEKQKEEISKDYVNTLGKFTKEVTFSNRSGTTIIPSPTNILSGMGLVSILRSTPGYGYRDPFLLLSMAKNTIKDHQAPQRSMHMDTKVNIGVIYYSNELINSQAKFFASKEGTGQDPAQTQAIADGIRSQIGTDLYTVFQVKIENRSETALQLAPFKWKISIITDDNQQIKSVKYDEALDKTIGPGQIAQGYVYFPKTDNAGNQLSNHKMKIKLESILNKKTELKWE